MYTKGNQTCARVKGEFKKEIVRRFLKKSSWKRGREGKAADKIDEGDKRNK